MNATKLPGISKIGYVDCSKLSPNLMLKSIAGIPIGILTDVEYPEIRGDATCEAVNDYDNNDRSEKSTLKFCTTEKIPLYKHLAFVVRCVDGTNYLIGAKERPFPVVKVTTETGTASGNPSITSVEVSHTAIKSLLQVAV